MKNEDHTTVRGCHGKRAEDMEVVKVATVMLMTKRAEDMESSSPCLPASKIWLNEEELNEHLFVSCPIIAQLWDTFCGIFGSMTPANWSVNDLIHMGEAENLTIVGRFYWRVVRHAIFWVVWKERNLRIFEEEKLGLWRLENQVRNLIWKWGLATEEGRKIKIEDVMFGLGRVVREV